MKRLRIYPQLIFGVGLLVITGPMVLRQPEWTGILWSSLLFIWIVGAILAATNNSWADWFLLVGSTALLGLGLFFCATRVIFMIRNKGLELPDGTGSPVMFILGWVFQIVLFLIPGLSFFIWNLIEILKRRKT